MKEDKVWPQNITETPLLFKFGSAEFNHEIDDPKKKQIQKPMTLVAMNKNKVLWLPKTIKNADARKQPKHDPKMIKVGEIKADKGTDINLPIM